MKAVSEFDHYNVDRLPEELLHSIMAHISFKERSVMRAIPKDVRCYISCYSDHCHGNASLPVKAWIH